MWEIKFLAHLRLRKLILDESEDRTSAEFIDKNADIFAEIVQVLDDKSLQLIMRDAVNDGRKALAILRDHYQGTGKPRIISLYTELTSLQMRGEECVTDYFLRAETTSTSLKSAGETISDSLLIAMVLKGLTRRIYSFNTVVMQKDNEPTFLEFKSLLRSYEESLRSREAHRPNVKNENVLKVNYKHPDFHCGGSASGSSVRCYSCGKPGHKSFKCRLKKDRDFDESKHMVELADGARCKNIVKGKGKAKIVLYGTNGIKQNVVLGNALYIPTFKQNIFSVQSAVSKGATVSFNPNHSELISSNGVSFEINKKGKLYYLNNVSSCKSRSLEEWHKVLGHCNVKDILKLEDKAEGMKISDKSNFDCITCHEGKMHLSRNRLPDERAKSKVEFVHCDLAGPMSIESREKSKYCNVFVDDYSGSVFVYFLKQKSDALNATKKFLADTSSYGVVKRLRCDNGGEFTSSEFKEFLVSNKIKQEFSSPNSPHQNGTAE
ncbi:uncharacterized protein LOC135211359 [Macrobrachium nipponense]|uniref:uncharacterized protein LOC135211359 n=1 Tax=Macrobrachium nipponense TaxID=159736 RepID=UPI0030C8AA4A